MENKSIGEQLNDSLAKIDELMGWYENLAVRLRNVERELSLLKQGGQIDSDVSLQNQVQVQETNQDQVDAVVEPFATDENGNHSYCVIPRNQNDRQILTIVDASKKQRAQFILYAGQTEARIEYNEYYEWSLGTLDAKLFPYVDYSIENKSGSQIVQISPGIALQGKNSWIVRDKVRVKLI